MRAGVPVPPRQLRKVRAHCAVFPRARTTSPPLSASPMSCSWLSLAAACPLPQTHGCSLLALPACPKGLLQICSSPALPVL